MSNITNGGNQPSIVPAVMDTPNGQYGYLFWRKDVDPAIQQTLRSTGTLFNRTSCGLERTPYGTVAWLLVLLDTEENVRNEMSDLFWFDLVLDPGDQEQTIREFIGVLETQNKLDIAIPINDSTVHVHPLIKGEQFKQYVRALVTARESWESRCDYTRSVFYLHEHLFRRLQEDARRAIARESHVANTPMKRLCFQFMQEVLARAPIDSSFRAFCGNSTIEAVEAHLNEWLARLHLSEGRMKVFLAEDTNNLIENLRRDWLFARLCYERSPKKLQVSVGSDRTGRWLWADAPYGTCPSIESLYSAARTYRYLLTENWRAILKTNDVLIPSINLVQISVLGRVPDRKAFGEVPKILQGAAIDRSFGIARNTAILINKPGLEEIEFCPTGEMGLQCLFKVKVAARRPHDYVVVGRIDAPAGRIEAVGIETSKEVNLLLFLVAIAYRDILVAREVMCSPKHPTGQSERSKRNRVKDRHEPIKLIPRIRYVEGGIDEMFASPERLVVGLRRFHSYLRSCHLRKLHEGWHASERQVQVAQQYRFLVPEGYTFVSPSYVSGEGAMKEREEFRSVSLLDVLFCESDGQD